MGSQQIDRMETNALEGNGTGNVSNKHDKYGDIKSFFYDNVCIEDYNDKYIGLMIENGFDSLDIIKTLENQDLVDIGVDKLDHRKKIMIEIQKL